MDFHLQVIKNEFARRLKKNPRYSMRAYAAHLELHPSALSRILAGKQMLSTKASVIVARNLELTEEEKRLFLQAVIEERKATETKKLGKEIDAASLAPKAHVISESLFSKVLNFDALAILELARTEAFQPHADWISKELGIAVNRVSEMISELLEIGLLQKMKDGALVSAYKHLKAVDNSKTDEIKRKHHQEILDRAKKSLNTDPIEKRAHYGMIMAIDPSRLQEANCRILAFAESLSDFLESGTREQVYQLAIQLFPISKGQEA